MLNPTPLVRGNFIELKNALDELPTDDSSRTINANRVLVAQIGERRYFTSIINEILASRWLLEEIASRSYRHINLFDKIVLVGNDAPLAYRLTLHFWNPPYGEAEMRQELIHEHRFNFWSSVLTGTLVSEVFQAATEGRDYRQYRYIPEVARARTFSDFYEFCGEARLCTAGPRVKSIGQSYYLAAPKIHRIILPRSSMTCTLVLRGPRQREYSYIYNTTYPTQNTSFTNIMFSPDELKERLSALLDGIKINLTSSPCS